ncbi:hypothetical protein AQI88_09210 [Streptomyces cellostaticus]|uniref:Uncharacterized protein n=1 Tax=Streptomyces cellostaticus TaxID=67285 RepID=A0A101NPQ7_9ACTN|nr:hypothetical protein [Streptomyces cellostaticus]KUM97168.1 hypothetical protein AQI88_09210 [Streptomyces cellostaticus]
MPAAGARAGTPGSCWESVPAAPALPGPLVVARIATVAAEVPQGLAGRQTVGVALPGAQCCCVVWGGGRPVGEVVVGDQSPVHHRPAPAPLARGLLVQFARPVEEGRERLGILARRPEHRMPSTRSSRA